MVLVRHLRKERLPSFNARVTGKAIGGALRDAETRNEACGVLVDAGLIRPDFTRAGDKLGRTAKNYDVNPVVLQKGLSVADLLALLSYWPSNRRERQRPIGPIVLLAIQQEGETETYWPIGPIGHPTGGRDRDLLALLSYWPHNTRF